MGKVDLFAADKAMSTRVADFMRIKVWNITLKARLEKAKADAEIRLENCEALKGQTTKDPAMYDAMIEDIIAIRDKAQADYDAAVKDGEKFAYTEQDKALYKAYKDGKTVDGLVEWFGFYGLEVDAETGLVQTLVNAFGGSKALSGRGVVRSNAEQFTKDLRGRDDILKVFYGKLAEAMMKAGTLKPEAIPEDVRDYYAPKKANKK